VTAPVSRELAAALHRTLEPSHAFIYFAPQAAARYAAAGVTHPRSQYFGSRAAPLGACGPEPVLATFYNFAPKLVRRSVPEVWTQAAPQELVAARYAGADDALRPLLDSVLPTADVVEAAELASEAAHGLDAPGRPLYAAWAGVSWPGAEQPHLRLFHALTLLREWRGDGHIAVLVATGIDPCESLVLHAATGGPDAEVLRATRGWSPQEWAAAEERLADKGLVDDGAATSAGSVLRRGVEDTTDDLDRAAWAPLGPERAERLRTLVRPLSRHLAPLLAVMANKEHQANQAPVSPPA
jgi:hypothetical protein